MRRYSEFVKADVRRRMSPPHSQSVARISEELGIRNIGPVNAKALAAEFTSAAALAQAALHDPETRLATFGIGAEIAEALAEWFSNPTNQSLLQDLQMLGFQLEDPADAADKSAGGLLSGKTFMLTVPGVNYIGGRAAYLIVAVHSRARSPASSSATLRS